MGIFCILRTLDRGDVSIEAELLKDLNDLNDMNSQLLSQKSTFQLLSAHINALDENKSS